MLRAKQRAGNIGEESGGPAAVLAHLETFDAQKKNGEDEQGFSTETSSLANNSAIADGVPRLLGAQALVQKRASPRSAAGPSSMIEALLSMQMLANQKADEDRAETRKREAQERKREKKERKLQRERDERREDMFLRLLGVGIAAFAGKNTDPTQLIDTLMSKKQDSDSESSSDDESTTKKKARVSEEAGLDMDRAV